MFEKYHQKILTKLQNKNLNFDEEEVVLLRKKTEYNSQIIKILSESVDYWNENILGIISEEYLLNMPYEYRENFVINYIKFQLNNFLEVETFDENLVEEAITVIDLTPETQEKIRRMVQQFIEEHPALKKRNIDDNLLQEIYDNKEYELLVSLGSNRQSSRYLSEELMELIINDFPYDLYETPELFGEFPLLIVNNLEKMSLKTLNKAANYIQTSFDIELKERFNTCMLNRLKEIKYEHPTYIDNISFSYAYFPIFSKEKWEILLYENNIINLINYIVPDTPEKLKIAISKLAEFINNENDKSIVENVLSVPYIYEEEIIDSLISNGYIDIIIAYDSLKHFPEKENLIIDNIKNGNPKYNKLSKSFEISNNLLKYKNILNVLAESNLIKSVSLMNSDPDSIEALNMLVQKNDNIEVNISNNGSFEAYQKLAKTFLIKKKYYNFINLLMYTHDFRGEKREKFIQENEEILIQAIKESMYFPNVLINAFADMVMTTPVILEAFFSNDSAIDDLLQTIIHHEEFEDFYNHENFLKLIEYFIKKYNINKENLLKLEERFGPRIIRYIDNENIQKILKSDIEKFNKIISLFPQEQYTMTDLEAAYDSLKQYEFSKNNHKEINIFPSILHAIEDENIQELNIHINKLINYLDQSLFKKIKTKYDLPEGYDENNPEMFIAFIIGKIKQGIPEKKEKYIDILHMVTDYYLLKKREEYRSTYKMNEELKLPYDLDQKSFDSEYFKYLIVNSPYFYVEHYLDFNKEVVKTTIDLKTYLIKKMISYNIDFKLAEETIEYFIAINSHIEPSSFSYSSDELKKNFKFLMRAIKEISKEKPEHYIFSEEYKERVAPNLKEYDIRKIYKPGPQEIDIYEILASLQLDSLEKGVLNNEEVYNSLVNTLSKRKIHILPKSLKNILNSPGINISDDFTNISSFISYYGQIYEKEKSNLASNNKTTNNIMLSLVNILINAEVYSSISSIYSQVLGDIDSKLIKANPGPNSASVKLANNGRLKEAIELTIQNFQRQAVTIPAFNEVIKLDNDKEVRIVVGNFTHPSNLTHGERTGACMRIGGAGETLFNFCLKNPNGFHIRFENPKTGKYVSRVSGFRNGNTVFLNELRYSCDDTYSNKDVVESCKKAADKLIELSKNSSMPIENIVIHRAYATDDMSVENVLLDKQDIKEGLPPFYSDVRSNVIILSTTATSGKFVPLNFDKINVPEYLPAREKTYVSRDIQEISSKITRVYTIKRILDGENYEYITPPTFKDGLVYAVINQDWYVYVDEKGKIHNEIINIDPRAKEELARALVEVENNLAQIRADNQEVKYGL